MKRFSAVIVFGLLVVTVSLLAQATGGANSFVLAHGSSESDGVSISSPSICCRKGEPIVAAGLSRLPGKMDEVSYIVIVRGDAAREKGAKYSSSSTLTGAVGSSWGSIKVLETEAAWKYEMTVEKETRKETFTVNDEKKDLSKGRIFLIDAEAKPFACTQLDAELPKLTMTKTTEESEALATKVLESLRKNKTAEKFLK